MSKSWRSWAITVKFTLKQPQASFLTKTLERASGRAIDHRVEGALEQMGDIQYGLTRSAPARSRSSTFWARTWCWKFDAYYDPSAPSWTRW
ncbi:MAG: hypothetical protein R3D85_12360 [Paracoccaceae bacterium]